MSTAPYLLPGDGLGPRVSGWVRVVLRPKHGAPYRTGDDLGGGHVQLQLDCRLRPGRKFNRIKEFA